MCFSAYKVKIYSEPDVIAQRREPKLSHYDQYCQQNGNRMEIIMGKILPLVMPPIETYQSSSFILGIILAHNHTKNAFCNKYINLVCNDTAKISDLHLSFSGVSWEDYRRSGIAEMDLYYLKNIAQTCFINFIKERIDQDNYILLYSIDEFYLSYSNHYTVKHVIHDTYIYGYDENFFHIMAYSNRKLQMLTVPMYEILNAMYHGSSQTPNTSFCTFRPYHAVSVQVDYNQILQGLSDFIDENKKYSDNRIYGTHVYDILQKCILSIINDSNHERKDLDLRAFRILWEHKKVLNHHIKLIKINNIDEMDEIERLSHIVFSLSMKYNITYDPSLLSKIIDYLNKIKERENKLIYALIQTCDSQEFLN